MKRLCDICYQLFDENGVDIVVLTEGRKKIIRDNKTGLVHALATKARTERWLQKQAGDGSPVPGIDKGTER